MEKKPGYLVETHTGKKGRTYHHESLVNGKQIVHVEVDGKPMKILCNPDTLKITGFID